MKTIAIQTLIQKNKKKTSIPTTPRGRALYITDWFLNGKPVLRDHDNPRMTLRNGMPC